MLKMWFLEPKDSGFCLIPAITEHNPRLGLVFASIVCCATPFIDDASLNPIDLLKTVRNTGWFSSWRLPGLNWFMNSGLVGGKWVWVMTSTSECWSLRPERYGRCFMAWGQTIRGRDYLLPISNTEDCWLQTVDLQHFEGALEEKQKLITQM